MIGKLAAVAVSVAALFAASGASAQKLSDDVVKIGVLTDMSGVYSDFAGQGAVTAAKMALEDYLARPGAKLAKKVEIISADHQNKADIAANLARTWYERDKVDAIVELVGTAVALAAMEVADQKGKITLLSGPASLPITNEKCTATNVHWTYDTYALSNGTAKAVVDSGKKSWYFLAADYAFGAAMVRDASEVVNANGGKVVGVAKHPFPNQDFSSFLLTAQQSKAEVIALANGGQDTVNAIKQAREFGVGGKGQRLASMLLFISDIHALGLEAAQGLLFADGFYWDLNDQTRDFAGRFAAQHRGAKPTMVQAGVYSSVLHYLKSVAAAKSDEAKAVASKMRELPIKDPVMVNASIRPDGRVIHDTYLVQVKSPAESKGAWDYLKVLSTIPAQQSFQPLEQSTCPLVAKK